MRWHNLRLLLIATPPHPDVEALAVASVDAVILQTSGQSVPVALIATTRPDLPLVVLADTDASTTLGLISVGADDVLASTASMPEIAQAVQHALVRRRTDAPVEVREAVPAPATVTPAVMPPLLESMFRLAGGVAQDFNNLLMIMEGNAERLLATLPAGDPLRGRVEAISTASRRGVLLTTKLLAFGRQQRLIPAPMDVNAVVSDACPILRRRLGPDIRLITELGPDLPQIRADRAQLTHVLSNLARTAAEVMPSGGTFTIKTDTAVVDTEMRRSRPWLASGPYVRLQLTDTGLGIEEQALPHLFEPFFASKGARGDGLDLPSVYGMVKQSGGFIWFDSRVDQGTRVTILLPPLAAAQPREGVSMTVTAPHVLLVEDDEEVRELLVDLLESQGLHVTASPSAEDAMVLESQQEFDLLITDVGLPGASGPQLAREVRRRSPRIPVLFISGHSGDIFEQEGEFDSPRAFLQKPFSSRTLVASLNDLLVHVRNPS